MSFLKTLGAGVSLTSAAAQTAVDCNVTPFEAGFSGIVTVNLTGATGTPTVKVQGSNDGGTTWTDLLVVSQITASMTKAEITLYDKLRLNVTAVGTAGTVSAYVAAVR